MVANFAILPLHTCLGIKTKDLNEHPQFSPKTRIDSVQSNGINSVYL